MSRFVVVLFTACIGAAVPRGRGILAGYPAKISKPFIFNGLPDERLTVQACKPSQRDFLMDLFPLAYHISRNWRRALHSHVMVALPFPSPEPFSLEDHLESWKEIAAYLNRDVRIVPRWEKVSCLPIH